MYEKFGEIRKKRPNLIRLPGSVRWRSSSRVLSIGACRVRAAVKNAGMLAYMIVGEPLEIVGKVGFEFRRIDYPDVVQQSRNEAPYARHARHFGV